MGIVDAQSVKNTDTAHLKGYDAGKKVSGIKRHIAVDTNGLPHAMHITAANVTDRDGAVEMCMNARDRFPLLKTLLCDGGYSGKPFQEHITALFGKKVKVKVVKRNTLHTFAVIPKRWVVERSFAWLEKCRRLWKNCERLVSSSKGMMQLAFIRVFLRRL